MRRFPKTCLLAAALALLATACSEATPKASVSSETSHALISARDFAKATFTDPAHIENRWVAMQPGTQWTWEGHALDDNDKIRRRVVITVTDLTKVVDGVRAVVAWDLDYNDGELAESEIAMFAQDDAGNVWHFGEYPEEYENGEIVKTPAWFAGYHGAKAGLAMKANPEQGTASYAQGWGPEVGWDDRSKIEAMAERTCVPVACYDDVLVIREFSRTEPGAYQLKYYAPGVGNVRVGWGGPNEEEQEELVLVDFVQLSPEALAEVRDKVLAQDARGYDLLPDVYGQTSPAEQLPTSSVTTSA